MIKDKKDEQVVSNTLQLAIEKKAKENLHRDLKLLKKNLDLKVGLMNTILEEFHQEEVTRFNSRNEEVGKTKLDLRGWFWSTSDTQHDSYGFQHLWKKYLPKYIEAETKNFVGLVGELKDRMDELGIYYDHLNEQ